MPWLSNGRSAIGSRLYKLIYLSVNVCFPYTNMAVNTLKGPDFFYLLLDIFRLHKIELY